MGKMSNLQQQMLTVEQLRREASLKRISVRQAIADIMKFVSEHQQDDYLMVGFSSQKANPFREKKQLFRPLNESFVPAHHGNLSLEPNSSLLHQRIAFVSKSGCSSSLCVFEFPLNLKLE